jgi:AAHS family 3-hydroxyphenylpropionic acid transporter
VLLWVVFVMTLVVLYLMLNWLPTLVVAKGLTPAAGSSAALAFNLTSIAGALLLGFVVDRAGYRWPVTFTFLLLALAMGALAAAGQLAAVLALSGVAGFLLLGAQYSLYAVIPSLYPPQVRAAGSGAAVAVGRLGSIAGPLVAGELRGAGYSAGQVFGVMIPVVLAAAAAVFALSWLAKPHGD